MDGKHKLALENHCIMNFEVLFVLKTPAIVSSKVLILKKYVFKIHKFNGSFNSVYSPIVVAVTLNSWKK